MAHKKPTRELKLHGTLDAEKKRYAHRHDEPQPTGKPVRPKLSKESRAFWDDVVPRLTELGIATDADHHALHMMAYWWGECKRMMDMTPEERHGQWVYMFATCDKQWRAYASKFGMTPCDRANLSVENKTESDPAAEFIA